MGTPIDFLGREVRLGDTVVYPRRNGSTIWLGKGKVRNIETRGPGFTHVVEVAVKTAAGFRLGKVPVERVVVVVEP